MNLQERLTGAKGTKILTGVGPHTGISTQALFCRVAGTIIAGYTEAGHAITLTASTDVPTSTSLEQFEMITFAGEVTSITLTAATDSITIIK